MVEILWGRSGGTAMGGLVLLTLDAALSQEHEYHNKATSFPVEFGLDITDHIRQEPDECKIEGLVSNTPDGAAATDGTFAASAYKALCAIAGRDFVSTETATIQNEYPKPILVDVIVRYRVFTDMILEHLSVPITPQTGEACHFSAHFKKIRKVAVNAANVNYTSSRIGGQDGVDVGQGSVDNGNQSTSPASDSLKKALNDTSRKFGDWWNGDISTAQLLGG
jgi:hypothetical protein